MKFTKNSKTYFSPLPHKIIFGGLTRNSAPYIESSLQCVRELGSLFRESKILIYENDSVDNTVALLQRNRVSYISENLGFKPYDAKDPNLTSLDRMAYYRNRLKEKLCEEDADFICIVDFDFLEMSWDGFFYSFSKEFDGVTAFGVCSRHMHEPYYYDYFAHREVGKIGIDKSCVEHYKGWTGTDFIPVDSAFGGIAIYRKGVYEAGEYRGGECEHVPFHMDLKAAGFQMVINPLMRVLHK